MIRHHSVCVNMDFTPIQVPEGIHHDLPNSRFLQMIWSVMIEHSIESEKRSGLIVLRLCKLKLHEEFLHLLLRHRAMQTVGHRIRRILWIEVREMVAVEIVGDIKRLFESHNTKIQQFAGVAGSFPLPTQKPATSTPPP